MTAKEARALMPVEKYTDKDIMERIKLAATNGQSRIWVSLSNRQKSLFAELDYTLEYLESEKEYRISW